MKEILMEHKGKLILSSLLVLVPILSGWLVLEKISLYPFFLLVLHWVCLFAACHDRKNREQNKKALGIIFWLIPMISLFTGTIFYLAQTEGGTISAVPSLMAFFFGFLFVICGSYFPKIRQNRTMGIKVKWAIENEENWNATHRFGGKLWIAGGFVCMVCGLFPDRWISVRIFTITVLIVAFVPCLYSYLYYRKQVAEGSTQKISFHPKKAGITAVSMLAVIGFMVWVLFAGNMEIVYGEDSFTVKTANWDDLTVKYEDIEGLEYQEHDISDGSSGSRTFGFGNLKLALGSFENERYGDYTRYTYVSCESCVVLTVKGETVVLNGPDEEKTREIYETIKREIS